jgi:hypothetical protein
MFARQVLSYPVGQASFDHGSYQQLAEGYYLRHDDMRWFFDQDTTIRPNDRRERCRGYGKR